MITKKFFSVFTILLLISGLTAGENEVSFSGEWTFSEEKSKLDEMGKRFLPTALQIEQKGNDLSIKKTFTREYEDDWVTTQDITLDGKECQSEFWNSPRVTTANWTEDKKSLKIKTKIKFERDGNTSELMINEVWTLKDNNTILSIDHQSESNFGERKLTLIFEKKKPQENKK